MIKLVLGIDEVGRGAWAGPLAVGAVVLDSDSLLCHPGGGEVIRESSLSTDHEPEEPKAILASGSVKLNDSKRLTAKQREELAPIIKQAARAIGVGWVNAQTIDKIGLSAALKIATKTAYSQIKAQVDSLLISDIVIVIDGTINFLDDPRVITMVKADGKIPAVSAASIIAKVFRDNYMSQLDKVFPDYEFAKHVGYGTALHREKLTEFGAIPGVHRYSFAPIAKIVDGIAAITRANGSPAVEPGNDKRANNMTAVEKISKTIGRIAENTAAEFLEHQGHKIIAQNWKNKFCEIDIISTCDKTFYFTEVKYRESANHGDGLDAITPRKLKKMKFAAELFLVQYNELAKNYDVRLSAISLSQKPPRVDEFIENIT
ncbi:ribonuclease HII [Candidatus Saccharibacteria bacterium]|nr:ribonuclease HII [Candidatus Saccharibacteria bacterium]MCL1963018.1 ribonuclease HII [Candidatus Saccharibacteria bacterium]